MDLDTREPAGELREGTWYERDIKGIQPKGNAIGQQRMKAGIRENHFHPAGRSRVPVKHRLEVLSDRLQHGGHSTMVRPVQSNRRHEQSYLLPSPLHRVLNRF